MKIKFLTLSLILTFFGSQKLYSQSISKRAYQHAIEIIQKYKLESKLNSQQKFKGYSVLAKELELYGHNKMAIKYYQLALENIPSSIDPYEIYTALISVLYRQGPKSAEAFLAQYEKALSKSNDPLKEKSINFWKELIKSGDTKLSFYKKFVNDQMTKKWISEKKYLKALSLLNSNNLENANINDILRFDILSRLNGKTQGFLCEETLKKFKQSSALTMEVCRYVKDKKLKYGNLEKLEQRSIKELPHITYLVKSLKDIK